MDKKEGGFDDEGLIREGFGDYFLHLTRNGDSFPGSKASGAYR